ncbi:hypothetical protein [Fusibacter sp. 3D3]|uniref:PglD-related sugar-binding protein n=1 Tax=Fusibacter sp. 3D3 TaxID=1048380 RepID=UPI000853923D|nr:hypothetical protein [Fusibacter sp. 3D3]GAU77773.1 acetyltransferase [Fusibacter sp. 3D3]
MKWNGLPVVIFGTGGISKEVYALIESINRNSSQQCFDVKGFVDEDEATIGKKIVNQISVITCDKFFRDYCEHFKVLGIVIPVGTPSVKRKIYDKIKDIKNLVYPNIIAPNAIFDFSINSIGYGNILTHGVITTVDIQIGNFNLINLATTLGHDSILGDFNVINPLCAISGNVHIGNENLLGVSCTILQMLSIGDSCQIGAGAVVTKNVDSNLTVVGIPAKELNKK